MKLVDKDGNQVDFRRTRVDLGDGTMCFITAAHSPAMHPPLGRLHLREAKHGWKHQAPPAKFNMKFVEED